jgi:soluble lytic murein transglycosylase-like protein
VGKRSYGVMQVKVTAARDMLNKHPELGVFRSDEELIARLMIDDEFNIRVASKYISYLMKKARTEERALVAYNIGLSAAREVDDPTEFKYVKAVKRYVTEIVVPYNEKYNKHATRIASA